MVAQRSLSCASSKKSMNQESISPRILPRSMNDDMMGNVCCQIRRETFGRALVRGRETTRTTAVGRETPRTTMIQERVRGLTSPGSPGEKEDLRLVCFWHKKRKSPEAVRFMSLSTVAKKGTGTENGASPFYECPRQESNLHGIATTRPST